MERVRIAEHIVDSYPSKWIPKTFNHQVFFFCCEILLCIAKHPLHKLSRLSLSLLFLWMMLPNQFLLFYVRVWLFLPSGHQPSSVNIHESSVTGDEQSDRSSLSPLESSSSFPPTRLYRGISGSLPTAMHLLCYTTELAQRSDGERWGRAGKRQPVMRRRRREAQKYFER